jgi:hypothetical protein
VVKGRAAKGSRLRTLGDSRMCLGGLTAFQRAEPGRQADGRRCVWYERERAQRQRSTETHEQRRIGAAAVALYQCAGTEGNGQWAMGSGIRSSAGGRACYHRPVQYSTVQCSTVVLLVPAARDGRSINCRGRPLHLATRCVRLECWLVLLNTHSSRQYND